MVNFLKKYSLLIVLLLIVTQLIGENEKIKYSTISSKEGLPQNTVLSIYQDNKGFIWFGTYGGLSRYDGYECKNYKFSRNDPFSISNDIVLQMIEDSLGRFWISTSKGLNLYLPKLDKFKRYNLPENMKVKDAEDNFQCLFQDKRGNYWVGINSKLYRFFPNKVGNHFLHVTEIEDVAIRDIVEGKNMFWLATADGLQSVKISDSTLVEGSIIKYNIYNENVLDFKANSIRKLYLDSKENLWIGIDEYPLVKFNIKTGQYKSYPVCNFVLSFFTDQAGNFRVGSQAGLYWYDTENDKLISHLEGYWVSSIFEDNTKNLWVGTWSDGVKMFPPNYKQFEHYYFDPDDPNSLSDKNIWTMSEDGSQNLWIWTSKGLNKYNKNTKQFEHNFDIKDPDNMGGALGIWCMSKDSHGNVWMSSSYGILCYNLKENKLINYRNYPDHPLSEILTSGNILVDSQDNLWVTFSSLFYFNQNEMSIKIPLNSSNNYTMCIDNENNLWFCNRTLNKYDHKRDTVFEYSLIVNDSIHLFDYQSIHMDKNKILWLSNTMGLFRFDPVTNETKLWTEENGLCNNSIFGILEDDYQNLWLSTNNGLSKFNKKTETFHNYYESDGLQNNEFNQVSYCNGKDGKMYFGGINGFNAFYPDSIRDNPFIPEVYIKELKINNISVNPGDKINKRVILNQSILETKDITLTYYDKIVSFEFVALHYVIPEKNQFAYKLEGYDDDWINVGNRRFCTYTSLPPGKYKFRVRASNSDGIWNMGGISLKIKVLPPWWAAWWFRSLVIFIVLGGSFFWYWMRLAQIKRQNIILEQKVKERTIEVVAQKNEIELQAKELEKLSIVASETENSIAILDAEANFEWVNDGFTRLHGFTLEEYIEKKGLNLAESSTNNNIKILINHCIKEKKPVIYQAYNISKNKKEIWTQTTLTPILDDNSNITKLITIEADIRKIKAFEAEILQMNEEISTQRDALAEANATKDKFFSIISHDLKSPFNSLLGFGEILVENIAMLSKEKIEKYAIQIFSSSKQLFGLVENLLEWSRTKRGLITSSPEKLNLQEVVNGMAVIAKIPAKTKQIKITLNIDSNHFVFADDNLISTIIRNLLSNAIKFSEKGGIIEISSKLKNAFVEVSVTDSGKGINQENLKKLFREDVHFTQKGTSNEKGTGLGLILCKEFIEKMGGKIWVESEVEKGTVFTFTIPVDKPD